MKDFWRALKYVMVNKKLAYFVFGLTLFGVFIWALEPLVYKLFFDLIQQVLESGLQANTYYLFGRYILLMIGLRLLSDIVSHSENYYIPKWVESTRRHLSGKIFDHLQSLSLSYFEKNGAGKIKERVDKGVSDLTRFIEGAFLNIIPQFLYITLAVFFLYRVNKILALIILLGIPFFIGITLAFNKKLRNIQDDVRNASEKSSAIAMESIINVRTIKSFIAERKQSKKFKTQVGKYYVKSMGYTGNRLIMNIMRFLIVDVAQIAVLALGVYWTLNGQITLGTLTLAWQYTNRCFGPLWQLTWLYDEMLREMRSIRRVFQLLDTNPEIVDIEGARPIKIKRGDVEFRNLLFKYDDEEGKKQVLSHLNLKIPAGKVVALVGKSGAGKSTIAKLLMHFYEPQSGSILIDGVDIKNVTQRSLRQNVGIVMQDSSLFNDTAENNIRFGVTRATSRDVTNAAKVAHADDFIKKLPKGYKTVVGERGVKLSGGEQQRINIARAILKNSPILILDEATSSLDSENEQLIQDALWKLIEGKTTIIIAHRLSTIMRADLIAVIDNGKVVELDTHENLIKNKGGMYEKLYQIQSGGYLK